MAEDIGTADGIRAKLERARAHLDALDTEVTAYLGRGPFDIIAQDYADYGGLGPHVAFVLRLTEHVPLLVSVLVGDLVHNLRSALDHIAWQLVVASGKEPSIVRPQTQFPIHSTRPEGKIDISPGIDTDIGVIVESLQPFQATQPDLHPLHTLREISNADKHRTLRIASAYALDASISVHDRSSGESIDPGPFQSGFLFDDAVIGWFKKTPGGLLTSPETEIRSHGTTTVSLSEVEPFEFVPIQLLAENLLRYVEDDVFSRLRPFIE